MGIRGSQTTISNNFLDFPNGSHDVYVCFAGKHTRISYNARGEYVMGFTS